MKMKIALSVLASSLVYSTLIAAPIAKESGFSGYVAGGVTSVKFQSNMIAGNAFDKDISDNTITSLNEKASKENSVSPSFDYNVKYTFADAQTEIFLGTDLEDALTFDATANLGVRKNFNGIGIIGASLLFSTMPTKVWKDPYDTTNARQSADQSSAGLSLKWEDIIGSNIDLEMRVRKYEIDGDDKSGLNTPYVGSVSTLPAADLNNQLNREGDLKMVIASYNWAINKNNHLKPELRFSDYDLDGEAMQYQRAAAKINYIHTSDQWNFVVTASVGEDDYKNTNPLFNKEADSTVLGAALTVGYTNPFGWSKKLSFLATVGGYETDSDIDFYDTSIVMTNISALYRF